MTLVLLKGGASLHPESAAGDATVHVLKGQIRVQTEGDDWNVGPAGVIVLGENLREPVTELEEAVFLGNSGLACRRRRIAARSR